MKVLGCFELETESESCENALMVFTCVLIVRDFALGEVTWKCLYICYIITYTYVYVKLS